MEITINQLLQAYTNKGYDPALNDEKEYNLNLGAIRCTNSITNQWDDIFFSFWKFNGEFTLFTSICTTKPGKTVFANPPTNQGIVGVAMIKEGHYPGLWHFVPNGHFGHDALMQQNPITVHRLTELEYNLSTAPTTTGLFGIDNHPTWIKGNPTSNYKYPTVDNWSEGCCVIHNPATFREHIEEVKQAVNNWGNSFSFTLFNITDINDSK